MLSTGLKPGAVDKEILLNLYIRLKNDFEINLKSFECSSGITDLNLCRVIAEMRISNSEEDLISLDMYEYRTKFIGMHWFHSSDERLKFLDKRISDLRRELSVNTYNSRIEKNKEANRFNL